MTKNKLHVIKGDRVKVIAGKDKGAVGEIIAVHPESSRVTVSGVNIVKRHLRRHCPIAAAAAVTAPLAALLHCVQLHSRAHAPAGALLYPRCLLRAPHCRDAEAWW